MEEIKPKKMTYKEKQEFKRNQAELVYQAKLRKIEERGERILKRRELKEKADSYKKPRKKIQTTKIITALLMIFLLLNCLAVEVYSAYAMFILQDLSALYSLIGAAVTTVIGEIAAFTIYACKSYAETREQAKIDLEYKKMELQSDCNALDDEPVG